MPNIDHGPVTLDDLQGRDFAQVWEVAAILGADRNVIRRQCREGGIPSVKVGALYKIPVAWLRAAAAGQPAGSQAAAS